jgi:hypothetical protein
VAFTVFLSPPEPPGNNLPCYPEIYVRNSGAAAIRKLDSRKRLGRN